MKYKFQVRTLYLFNFYVRFQILKFKIELPSLAAKAEKKMENYLSQMSFF